MASELEVGNVKATNKVVVTKNQQTTTGTPFSGAAIKVLPSNTTNTTGVSSLALSTSTVDNYGYLISGHRAGSDGGPTLRISSHSSSDTGTEVLTIDSSGKVGIGVSPASLLHVTGDSNSNGGELTLQVDNNNTTDNIGTINFGNNIDRSLSMIQSSTSGNNTTSDLSFHTSATGTQAARLTIASNGVCTFGVGINLGHQNLTKYQEGSFTPTIGAETGTINGTNIVGRYTRIGNVCHVWFSIECTGVSGASGAVEFGNFPFTSSSISSGYNTPMVVRYVSLGSAVESLVLRMFNNSSGGRIEEQNGTSVTNLADNVQNGTIFQVAGSYRLSGG